MTVGVRREPSLFGYDAEALVSELMAPLPTPRDLSWTGLDEPVQPELWRRRNLAVILDGMRATCSGAPREPLDVPPVDWRNLAGVMSCWRPPQRRGQTTAFGAHRLGG